MKKSEFQDIVDHMDILEKQVALASDQIRLLRRRMEVIAENDSVLPQLKLRGLNVKNPKK